jgi:hypothetical protein
MGWAAPRQPHHTSGTTAFDMMVEGGDEFGADHKPVDMTGNKGLKQQLQEGHLR